MISRYNKAICTLILPLLLTGCWDYMDVNKRSINLSVGIDDVDGNVQYAVEMAKLLSNTSSGGRGMTQITDVYYLESLGENFEKSRAELDNKLPFQDFTGALRVMTFSKKYAEKIGIESYINRTYYIQTFRNSVLLTVSKESSKELFKGMVENDICTGYGIEDTIRYLDDNGLALYKTTQEVKSDIEFKSIGYLLPYVTRENNTIKYLGLAAMKDSKLAGIVKPEESNGFLFVLSKQPTTMSTIPNPSDEKVLVSTKTTLGKRKIRTSYENKKINIYIDLKLNSQLQYVYNIKPVSNDDIKKIEDIISSKIKEDIISAVSRSQNEFKCDVFGLGRYFKAENPMEYRNIKWKDEYPNAILHVNVKTTILNTNLLDLNAKKPH
ncbi:MAG: spore gernimation protein GerC [Clostridiaceae bacterium]|jgi:spore germination protein KC|nr:spore gernimation protein GerC [Clostridiaceae bacterium]